MSGVTILNQPSERTCKIAAQNLFQRRLEPIAFSSALPGQARLSRRARWDSLEQGIISLKWCPAWSAYYHIPHERSLSSPQTAPACTSPTTRKRCWWGHKFQTLRIMAISWMPSTRRRRRPFQGPSTFAFSKTWVHTKLEIGHKLLARLIHGRALDCNFSIAKALAIT